MGRVKRYLEDNSALAKSLLKLSLPAIGEMSLNTLVGVMDTLMISYLVGSAALSAVGFANQVIFTLIFIFSAFNTGATALVSRYYGEQNFEKLRSVAGQGLTINIIIGFVVTVGAYYFRGPIFGIYEVSKDVFDLMMVYFIIVLVGMVPMFIAFSGAAILRGVGDTMAPMKITAFANILNIIGNYVLIVGWGPFPQMGVAGAAWSTTFSRIVAALLYIYILFYKEGHGKIEGADLHLTKDTVKPLWKISYPGAIEQALMQTSFLALGVIISKLDTVAEAAFRVLSNIESLSFMPAVGMAIASATLTGKSLGEKNEQNAMATGYISGGMSIVWGLIMGVVFIAFPRAILGIFTPEVAIVEAGVAALMVAGVNNAFLNFNIVMGGVLRGAGDTRTVMLFTVFRLWGIFLPLSYFLILKWDQGVMGLWQAELISFLIFSSLIFKRFKGRKWMKIEL